jgi:ABC-2 type transport system permease protein
MRRTTAMWLVARREIIERGRTRGYLISLVFTLGILLVAFVVPSLMRSDTTRHLALVGPTPANLEPTLQAVAAAQKVKLDISSVTLDLATAKTQLTAKAIDAALVVPEDLSGPGTLYFGESVDSSLQLICTGAVVALRAGATAAPPSVEVIAPLGSDALAAIVFANAGIILMFIGIFTYGQWVLTGVVEEKQSRVVEVVLSTVRPRDLLVGKVLGIGTLAIGQLAILVGVGLVASQLLGRVTLPATTGGAVAQLVLWFVLGFLFYATAMGALGSLASRPEEANNAAMPVTMSATVVYMASILFVVQEPGGVLAQVMTFIPLAAPMVVPLRVALNAIEPWEVVVSIAVMLVAIWLLFEAGARVYSGAVLASGGRIKLREAWRARR